MSSIDLRSYVFLDSLQPQHAAFLSTISKGFLPLTYDASLFVEISPGIEINRLTDIALKSAKVRPAMQIVERYYGLLEVHASNQADVRAAGAAILEAIGLKEEDRIKPKILRPPSISFGTEKSDHVPCAEDLPGPGCASGGDSQGDVFQKLSAF